MANPSFLNLKNKRILITGASAGIGRASAALFSKLGAEVILSGRNKQKLQSTAELLDGKSYVFPFNLNETDAIPAWIKDITNETGKINGLAHCAGIQITKPIRIVDSSFIKQTFDTNVASAILLAKALRHKKSKGDKLSIVLVSSIAALIGQPGNSVYSASKGALISLTKSLAMELMRDDIRVNCVAPALINTDMADRTQQGMSEEQFQYILDQHPMGIGKSEDVASTIAFLLSDKSKWITGITQLIDGGYMSR